MKRTLFLLSTLLLGGALSGWGQATKETAKANAAVATNATAIAKPGQAQPFLFGGGDFNQFMTKLRDVFGKEVYELIEIRQSGPDRLRVPKMRIQGVTDIREVLLTYNAVSKEGDGFLGEWIFSPSIRVSPLAPPGYEPRAGVAFARQPLQYDSEELTMIVFLGPKGGGTDGSGEIKVRAFSVRGLAEERLKALNELIREESGRLQREIAERGGDVSSGEGRLNVHSGTRLLVASGGEMYVELVATLMEAFMTNTERVNATLGDHQPDQTLPKPGKVGQ
jgi:hypothetical protein